MDGDRLTARAWIVATGSSPSLPPVEGIADVPYWTNETVFSQTELPGRLVVLGGGPIGVEMAQAFRRLGSDVTVVEYADQVLGPEDPDIAAILRGRLEAEGVKVLTGTKALKAAVANAVGAAAGGAVEGGRGAVDHRGGRPPGGRRAETERGGAGAFGGGRRVLPARGSRPTGGCGRTFPTSIRAGT